MADKKQILFVDDEQNVLDGLRRMLRIMRDTWDMAFAISGQEALDLLAQKPCDVIVSDMRMPGMSGGQLLAEVHRRHPGVVRLVLSGQADRQEILKHVGPIHQFLQKPCDVETLTSAINRTCELGSLLKNESLRKMVAELESLPSLPAHQENLTALLEDPDVTPKEIGEAISQDLAMTAKILQLVNSSFFGLRRHIGSPGDAVTLLGLDTVRSLVLTMQVFSQIAPDEVSSFSQDALLSHSVTVADIARKIDAAEDRSKKDAERAYMAGLLHDVGKLILAARRPREFSEALATAESESLSVEEAERRVIGATHGELGGYLLGLWAFESPVVDAATFHHCPGRHTSDVFTTLTAVHVANAISHHDSADSDEAELDVDMDYLDRIGISDRLPVWQGLYQCAA